MDSHSQETLQRVEQNENTFDTLRIGGETDELDLSDDEGRFTSSENKDFARLVAILILSN